MLKGESTSNHWPLLPAEPVIKELDTDARLGCLLEKLKLKQHADMTHGSPFRPTQTIYFFALFK